MKYIILLLLIMISLNVNAQNLVFKCNYKGKIIYSNDMKDKDCNKLQLKEINKMEIPKIENKKTINTEEKYTNNTLNENDGFIKKNSFEKIKTDELKNKIENQYKEMNTKHMEDLENKMKELGI